MEADWEIEIGGDAPVIHADWPGFIDLRQQPHRVHEISEAHSLPQLAEALLQLNSPESAFFTSKCDVFEPGPIDPDELSATPQEAAFVLACYVDLLLRNPQTHASPAEMAQLCRSLCASLHPLPLRCCRVDLVIREAHTAESGALGITAYLTGCGPTPAAANAGLAACLAQFVQILIRIPGN